MNVEEAKQKIEQSGYHVTTEKRLANETGTQLFVNCDAQVNIFDTGKWHVQGKNPGPIKTILENGSLSFRSEAPSISYTKVFVVYGHDMHARTQLEAMLLRWGLEPLILDQLPSQGQTVIEKLENYLSEVSFGVVLATPDDEGHRTGHPDEKQCRARQNVVLELGMLLSQLGRKKIAVLLKQGEMERPSDIQGLIYIPFKDDLQKDVGLALFKEMVEQGYKIDPKKI